MSKVVFSVTLGEIAFLGLEELEVDGTNLGLYPVSCGINYLTQS